MVTAKLIIDVAALSVLLNSRHFECASNFPFHRHGNMATAQGPRSIGEKELSNVCLLFQTRSASSLLQ